MAPSQHSLVSGLTDAHSVTALSKEHAALPAVLQVSVSFFNPEGESEIWVEVSEHVSDAELSEATAQGGYLLVADDA